MKASNEQQMWERLAQASVRSKSSEPSTPYQQTQDRLAKQAQWEQEIKNRRLTLPVIPTREEANRDGCFIPADFRIKPLGWTPDIVALVGDLPSEMDPRHVEAYRLFPAFMADYGRRYFQHFPVSPASVLEGWKTAIAPSDYQMKQNKFLMPSELRLAVEEFANPAKGKPQFFNIAPMRNTVRYRSVGDPSVREAIESAARGSQFLPDGTIAFYQHVSPYKTLKGSQETDWASIAGYPQAFPDALLTSRELSVINRVTNHRFQNDEAFTSIKGRWLAGTMVQAVSFELRRGITPSVEKMVDLGFRFSNALIARSSGEVISPSKAF